MTNKPGKTGNVRDNNNTFVFLIKVVLIGIDSVLSGTRTLIRLALITLQVDQFLCVKKIKELYSNPRHALKT